MPTTNSRKHTIPTGGEASFTRGTIFSSFGESINDVIPVANTTERAAVITALDVGGEESTAKWPVVVARGDAPGLHRIEYTYDGINWFPMSGVLTFPTKAAADSFGTGYPGLLSTNDRCVVGGVEYTWRGSWSPIVENRANPGTSIAGVAIPQGTVAVDVLIRTGLVVSGTDVNFGNGYMPPIGLPFPNGVLSLQLTEIVADGATKSASGIAFDVFDKTQFRAFYPGDTASVKRAFTWLALGY